MESTVSPVAQGQGSPVSTPQDMNHSNNNPLQPATLVPNQPPGMLGTSAPATNLPISQPHQGVPNGMAAGVPPAAVGRVAQPPMTLAHIMPAGQPHRPGPVTSGQPQRPGGPGVVGRARTSAATPQLAVRQPPTAFLPPGSAIPPGMALIRTEVGMAIVPHHVLAQIQANNKNRLPHPAHIQPRPSTPTSTRPVLPPLRVVPPHYPPHGMAGGRNPFSVTAQANQKLSDPGGGTFRDDDINDVASMAGVNLNEENARILAASSELVGTKIRSCKDENFLFLE